MGKKIKSSKNKKQLKAPGPVTQAIITLYNELEKAGTSNLGFIIPVNEEGMSYKFEFAFTDVLDKDNKSIKLEKKEVKIEENKEKVAQNEPVSPKQEDFNTQVPEGKEGI